MNKKHTGTQQGDGQVYPTNADIAGGLKLPAGFGQALQASVKEKTDDPTVLRLIDEIEEDFQNALMFDVEGLYPTRETANALRVLADGIDATWQKLG